MKQVGTYMMIALWAACLVGCGPSEYVLKSGGDIANITTRGNVHIKGEFLCLQDSSVYLLIHDQRITRIAIRDIYEIDIEGYSNRSWVTPLILFQAVPTVLLTIAASEADADVGIALLVFGGATVLTYVALEASTPAPPGGSQPFTEESIDELRKYARFPQGLNPDQLQQRLRRYKQIDISRAR